jgi:hypothetical protein
MRKTADVRVVATWLHFLEVKNRIPLKFGSETTTEVTCARVRVGIAAPERAVGLAQQSLLRSAP